MGHIITAPANFDFLAAFAQSIFGPVSLWSLAVGVGHNPDPISPVRRTNGARGYTMPFRIIPERSERPEHLIQSARAKGADIFNEDVARPERGDRFGVLEPESAAFAGESGAFSGEADVLAGEPPAQQVDGFDG